MNNLLSSRPPRGTRCGVVLIESFELIWRRVGSKLMVGSDSLGVRFPKLLPQSCLLADPDLRAYSALGSLKNVKVFLQLIP